MVVGPDGSKVFSLGSREVDSVSRSEKDVALSQTKDPILHFLEQVRRHGHKSPDPIADVFSEEAVEPAGLYGRQTLLSDVPQQNARELGAAPCRGCESRFSTDERANPLRIGLIQIALRHVRRVQIPTQDRSSSRNRPLSLRRRGNFASTALRSGRVR